MSFDMNGDLSDTIDKARVFVIVDDSVKPVEVRTHGIYWVQMYSEDYMIGDYVYGKSNNIDKNIIAVGSHMNNEYVVGRVIGKNKDIAKVLI